MRFTLLIFLLYQINFIRAQEVMSDREISEQIVAALYKHPHITNIQDLEVTIKGGIKINVYSWAVSHKYPDLIKRMFRSMREEDRKKMTQGNSVEECYMIPLSRVKSNKDVMIKKNDTKKNN